MKIKRIILGTLLSIYLIIAIFLTACLLTYNDYKISVFGDKSLVIVKNDDFEPDYKKGSLLIITKNANEDIKVNDEIFFYTTYGNQMTVSHSKVTKVEKVTDTETTFTLEGGYPLSSEWVIGKADTTKVMNGVGSFLSVLESRWGFLFMIVLPISVLFIYEIYVIVKEIVRPDEEEQKEKVIVVNEEPKNEEPKVEEKIEQPQTEIKEEINENIEEKKEDSESNIESEEKEEPKE